uniref:Uncharacterized protein n=1 Tax=Cyprinus carpio TaxID=7962 RepID=A0A8C1KNT3_CYPCA
MLRCTIILCSSRPVYQPIFLGWCCNNRLDSKTNLSCGFRYVNLTHRQHVLNALNALIELTGKPIRLMWAETDSTLRKSVIGNIIIKGLAKDINNLALSRTFSGFRKILSSRVVFQVPVKILHFKDVNLQVGI